MEGIEAKKGTYGLAVSTWGEAYAVCANWAEASSPVWSLAGDGEWVNTGRQVADYRHDPRSALEHELREVSLAGGDELDEKTLEKIMGKAYSI